MCLMRCGGRIGLFLPRSTDWRNIPAAGGGEEVRECWRNPARRGVVERTFVWLVRWRRLVRDYERRLDVSESMIQIAMASILLKRFIIDK